MIYPAVFAAGSTALARASKALQAETWDALHRYGVWRVNIEADSEKWESGRIHHRYLTDVQTVHIRIIPPVLVSPNLWDEMNPDPMLLYRSLEALHRLVEWIHKPRTCRIQFTMAITSRFVSETLRRFAWWLSVFESVDVEFVSYEKDDCCLLLIGYYHYICDKAVEILLHSLCQEEEPEENWKTKVTVAFVNNDIDL